MRDISKLEYMYAWFFVGGHLGGTEILCGGGGGGHVPPGPLPVATPLKSGSLLWQNLYPLKIGY